MNEMEIKLAGGQSVKMQMPSYVLQAWFNGKWNNIEAHPYTEQGYQDAVSGYDRYDYPDMQVQTFN